MALRIPVISVEGHPLMPTTPAKARKLLRNGAAKGHYNKLGMFCLRLCTSVGPHIQALKLAIDYGSKYDGYAVGGLREVCLTAMAKMPTRIAKKMTDRGRLRRTRRYRLWQRPKRFTNRKQQTGWLAPSQHAKVVFRRKIVTELARTFPLTTENAVEDIAFNHYQKRWGRHFSTAEIGKTAFYQTLKDFAPLVKFKGWQTAQLRNHYGIPKSKQKAAVTPESHANDAVAMLCGLFGMLPNYKDAVFWYWQRPEFARRALHRQNHQKGHHRPLFGGTTNGNPLRKGDYVEAEKAGKRYYGWVCGLPTAKTPCIGVMNAFGKRVGQFTIRKVQKICASKGLLWYRAPDHPIPPLSKGRGLLAK